MRKNGVRGEGRIFEGMVRVGAFYVPEVDEFVEHEEEDTSDMLDVYGVPFIGESEVVEDESIPSPLYF